MAVSILLFVALAGVAHGQTQCAGGLGVCSYSYCSRYYTPTTRALCPSSLQRCCALSTPDICQTKYGGTCQNRGYSCSGSAYTHDSTSQLCSSSTAVCCIKTAPTSSGGSSSSGTSSTGGSSSTTCGIRTSTSRSKRIVGGNAAEKGEWPWQVSILRASSSSSAFHSCGGTLVSPQWVVTAAHCFKGVSSKNSLRVRVGEHNFRISEGTESNAVISQIVIHSQYVASQNANDIAMIKLSKPVDISGQYTRTACLPTVSDLNGFYATSECYTTGWGKTQGTGGDQQVLQEVKSSLVSQSDCYRKWGYKIDNTKVCFGNGYQGACQGDSGGPLVCKKDGQFHLVGVVSYGSKSCVERYVPTVFTNVAQYRTWIDRTMSSY